LYEVYFTTIFTPFSENIMSKTPWRDLAHTDAINCVICGSIILLPPSHVKRRYRHTCGGDCLRTYRERFSISPDHLFFEVWSRPTMKIAAELGVSDKAIDKRCKREGVTKPPRGYWAKINAGVAHRDALAHLGWTDAEIRALGERKFAPKRINI
jgi:hypothetical protein